MKKLVSLIVAIIMIASLATVAFAAGSDGTITINNAHLENTYAIYKMLTLESYSSGGQYSYKVVAAWEEFFRTGAGAAYFDVSPSGFASWKESVPQSEENVVNFSRAALVYAQTKGITPDRTTDNAGDYTVIPLDGGKNAIRFADLPLGYYLVDSTMGILCGLTTTNPNASIDAKNGSPTIKKDVYEDDNGEWGNMNTADISENVKFRVTIAVYDGAQNYVMHDKMTAGLTFAGVEKVEHVIPVMGSDPKVTVAPTTYYAVVQTDLTDDCTFEVRFTQEFLDHVQTGEYIVVYYSATVNANAVAGVAENNEAYLTYGDDHYTTHTSTETFTWGFDLVKTDDQNMLLDGATFRIYDAATGGHEIPMVKGADGVYRHAQGTETGELIVVTDGKVRVEGLDNGIYYLEEVDAPAGYHKLTARTKFTIADKNLDSIQLDGKYSGGGVQIINKSGSILPQTGGMGTMLFVTFGTMVVLGTGVLLVTKKRMGMIVD